MRYLPDGSQMREGDLYTIEHIGIPSMVLMERAALETVRVMEENKLDLSKTLIVCGSGNNGGDGFAIGRLLSEKGYTVTIAFVGSESSLSEQARSQKEILETLGITIKQSVPEKDYSVILDAIFGVGLSRAIEGHYLEMIQKLNRMEGTKVAVDIPSGIDATAGTVLGDAFRADITVSYAFEKLGTVLYPGKEYAGDVYPVRIGIPTMALSQFHPNVVYTYEQADLEEMLPKRKADSHKGSYGKVLMITGSKGMSGAAYLSAKAAYRSGAGLVQIYTTEDNREILQQMLPEAIITTYQEYEDEKLAELLDWADVIAIGSGLGTSEVSQQLLVETIRKFRVEKQEKDQKEVQEQKSNLEQKKLVIDADGLNILANHIELLEKLNCQVVLTPHMKEMSRLLKCTVGDIKKDRFTILRTFVEKYPVTCALKDARTLVMTKEESPYLNTSGNAAMAKAGSGDVLTGVVAGMLAQGKAAHEGASLGVYIHGLGGDIAKEEHGMYGTLARDLITGVSELLQERI